MFSRSTTIASAQSVITKNISDYTSDVAVVYVLQDVSTKCEVYASERRRGVCGEQSTKMSVGFIYFYNWLQKTKLLS